MTNRPTEVNTPLPALELERRIASHPSGRISWLATCVTFDFFAMVAYFNGVPLLVVATMAAIVGGASAYLFLGKVR